MLCRFFTKQSFYEVIKTKKKEIQIIFSMLHTHAKDLIYLTKKLSTSEEDK